MDVENKKESEPVTPQPEQPLLGSELKHDELHDLKEYLRENGMAIAIMFFLVFAIIIVAVVYRSNKSGSLREAAQMLAAARTEKDLETIAREYGSTPYGPLAMLRQAKGSFNAGDYDRADGVYQEFIKKYPKHPMADAAAVNHFFCLEAKGQTEAALQGFTAFSTANTNHFMQAETAFGKVRCLETLGRMDEAQAACEDFIAAYPESGWLPKANEMLGSIKKKIQSARDAQAAAPANTVVQPAK